MNVKNIFGLVLFAVGALVVSSVSLAEQKYICKSGDSERLIEVVYTSPETRVPCEVRYSKEGETQTLWSAQSQLDYCETKAAEFVEKQRGWGWECSVGVQATAEMSEETPVEEN